MPHPTTAPLKPLDVEKMTDKVLDCFTAFMSGGDKTGRELIQSILSEYGTVDREALRNEVIDECIAPIKSELEEKLQYSATYPKAMFDTLRENIQTLEQLKSQPSTEQE